VNAVVLVGGEGTRLRPLTEQTPKPMLPLLDRPLLAYALDHLRDAGVRRAILACGYLPDEIEAEFGSAYEGLALEYRLEPEPLGTGGAIRFAAEGIGGTFLALNGDSLRTAPIDDLLDFHHDRKAKATILLEPVPDPSRYGLVRTDASGRVQGFVEKPEPGQIDGNLINAGLYVLEPEVLDLIPGGRAVSIERDVFPALAAAGDVFALALPGYWIDIGTPSSYLQAHLDLLSQRGGIHVDPSAEIGDDVELVAPVLVGARARVEAGASIGPGVHLGRDAQVGRGAVLRRSAVLPGGVVPPGATITQAIVAPETGVLQP
jgi:mannose-1-phosphate guanylyltransferase